jgi:enoyl-CoA hydratase/3-hydroxyacyl-CoA dehydrogenase
VAIVGAGAIGPDIGYYLKSALPGLAVTLVDIAQSALDAAIARFGDYANKAVARGKMSQAKAEAVTQRVNASTRYAALGDADWIIEAATENHARKQQIITEINA